MPDLLNLWRQIMKKLLLVLSVVFFMTACEGEGCKNMSWEASSSLSLKSGAGNQCGNINDYYDIDIDGITSKIQKMKFVIEKCTDEAETVDCPDFVPQTIEFNEMTGCKFNTPPGENDDCETGPLSLQFSGVAIYGTATWVLDGFQNEDPLQDSHFDMVNGDVKAYGYEDLITFFWTEESEAGVETDKKLSAEYSVETK
jgi:hypothetical protein